MFLYSRCCFWIMDYNSKDFSERLVEALSALEERVSALEAEVAALKGGQTVEAKQSAESESVDLDPIDLGDLDIDVVSSENVSESVVTEDVVSPETVAVLPEAIAEELPEEHPEETEMPEEESETEVAEESGIEAAEPSESDMPEDLPESEVSEIDLPEPEVIPAVSEEEDLPEVAADDDLSEDDEDEMSPEGALFGAEETYVAAESKPHRRNVNEAESSNTKKAVIDVMTEKLAWKTDMPGAEVKDIRSAISLNDRVMFINSLFRDDSMLFQDTITRLNAMKTLSEAVKYLKSTFPEWKMSSDKVYRFMMAVRRKIRQ